MKTEVVERVNKRGQGWTKLVRGEMEVWTFSTPRELQYYLNSPIKEFFLAQTIIPNYYPKTLDFFHQKSIVKKISAF